MSEPMKKRPIKTLSLRDASGRLYQLPLQVAEKYRQASDSMHASDFFAPYERAYTKPGLILKGIRLREGMTQATFAQSIAVSQPNLSKMESGQRPIGKGIAKRIAAAFDVDYRSLL